MRNVRAWIGLAMVTVVVWGMGLSAFAEPKPSDFLMEEIGLGILGGLLTDWVGESGCSVGSDVHLCNSFKIDGVAVAIVWVPLGTSLGVITIGSLHSVAGNVPLTILFAVVGSVVVGYNVFSSNDSSYFDYVVKGAVWLGLTASLATAGYNIGAKMKSDKSKPAALNWSLPVVALRF